MAHELNTTKQTPRRSHGMRAIAAFCRRLAKDLFDPYHPERHYMRGPGPKWQAKHSFGVGASGH